MHLGPEFGDLATEFDLIHLDGCTEEWVYNPRWIGTDAITGGQAITSHRRAKPRAGRPWATASGAASAIGLAAWLVAAASASGSTSAEDSHGDVLTAGSVCEAHELKARKQANPQLQIAIPAEYDKPWPSPTACESHELAWSADAPGPKQPIPFSHRHHAGEFGIDCQYCHSATDRSRTAGVPSVEVCMGCHAQFPAEYDELEGIRILKQHWADKQPIQWQQIHRVPEHVKFRHNRHLAAGVSCETCHGPVGKLDKLSMVPDTKWWVWGLPTKKLEMGWCIKCHRQNDQQASQDCMVCHY